MNNNSESESLWGELPKVEDIRPPITILREQASLLGKLTNGLLRADVKTETYTDLLVMTFRIIAPAIDDYTYEVFSASHEVYSHYPVELTDHTREKMVTVPDEATFIVIVGGILRSPKVINIVGTLMVQSTGAGP